MFKKNIHIFSLCIGCFLPIQTMENEKYIDKNAIVAFKNMLQLPIELQNTIFNFNSKYETDSTLPPTLQPYDAKFITQNNIVYDKTIDIPKEFIDTYNKYIVTNAIRYQYRADTRFTDYNGPLDTAYYNKHYTNFETLLSNPTPSLEALVVQTFDNKSYMITYASPESINNSPYRFFLHKLYTASGCQFITPPNFSAIDDMSKISSNMSMQEYEKITCNNATNALLLVPQDEYNTYNKYTNYISGRYNKYTNNIVEPKIKIAVYNYELLAYVAHCYAQALAKNKAPEKNKDYDKIISYACNVLRLFHSDTFDIERKWFKSYDKRFLNMITRMRNQLITNIYKSDNPLLYLQDTTIFPENIKGSQNIQKLINFFTDPKTLACYDSLVFLDTRANIIKSLQSSDLNREKINAIYQFCNTAQEIAVNLDSSFNYTGHHPIQAYDQILENILAHNFTEKNNAANEAYVAFALLNKAINNSRETIKATYQSITY